MTHLDQLKSGDKVKIVGYEKTDTKLYRQKLLAMGLTPGTILELIRIAPLGDPIQIKLRGFSLSLRKKEARNLKLEMVTA